MPSDGANLIRNRDALATTPERAAALDCVAAGVERADPGRAVREAVAVEGSRLRVSGETYDLDGYDEVVVLGGGKAAAGMAAALEDLLGERVTGGAVVTDTPVDTDRVAVHVGNHPVPDEAGVEGARRVRELAAAGGDRTLVLAVVAGGGSALLPAPAGDLGLADLRATTDALLASGAPIGEVNAVRKHLSEVKGGQLARAAAPATVVGLVVSDVVGDDLSVIASGPLTPDPSTYGDALAVLDARDVGVPARVREHLEAGAAGDLPETPTAGDPAFDRVAVHVVADAMTALRAAAERASDRGYDPLVLSSRVRGEAREAALSHVAVGEEVRATGTPLDPPAAVLAGGETTVTVRGDGRGGPNQEFALAAALELDDSRTALAAVDTDGRDGGTDAAGALVDADTVPDDGGGARAALDDNDAATYLAARDALVDTGATGTNVNDLRVLVVGDAE